MRVQILEDGQRFTFSSGLRTVGVFGGEGTMQQQVRTDVPDPNRFNAKPSLGIRRCVDALRN
jgi:hypothetical protein